ncbi:uncharacterized protein [Aristolochia californica]|uniref:uncharacterized protein n=1 Tax=Aristolochia californica TaxID=171875 RepID=UPI0035E06F53
MAFVPARQERWLVKLMGYDFDIQYRPVASNRVVDAFSRKPDMMNIAAVSGVAGFQVDHGQLFYNGRLVLSKNGYGLILAGYEEKVTEFVQNCEICQKNKHLARSPAGLLQPIDLPEGVWEDLTMDFIEGLPKSEGVDTIMVVVKRLSKYAHFLVLRHPFTAKTVADLFVKQMVRLHGVPKSIISDWDKGLICATDGQSEVVNRWLETYLRCFASDRPKTWAKWLSWAEYWYNTNFHSSTGTTLFRVLYGRDPQSLLHYKSGTATVFVGVHVEKLAAHFYGSFEVVSRVGSVAYKLQLLPESSVHPVFHVSQLRRAKGISLSSSLLPPQLNTELEMLVEPAAILNIRRLDKNGQQQMEVLVQWKDLPQFEATWEDFEVMRLQFPAFHLEDKVKVWAGGNDRPHISITYSRSKQKDN